MEKNKKINIFTNFIKLDVIQKTKEKLIFVTNKI